MLRRHTVKLTLRVPEGLHAQLAYIAGEQARSLNAQIVYLLRRALRGEGEADSDSDSTVALLGEVAELERLNARDAARTN